MVQYDPGDVSEEAIANSVRTVEKALEENSESVAEKHRPDDRADVQEENESPIPGDSVET